MSLFLGCEIIKTYIHWGYLHCETFDNTTKAFKSNKNITFMENSEQLKLLVPTKGPFPNQIWWPKIELLDICDEKQNIGYHSPLLHSYQIVRLLTELMFMNTYNNIVFSHDVDVIHLYSRYDSAELEWKLVES